MAPGFPSAQRAGGDGLRLSCIGMREIALSQNRKYDIISLWQMMSEKDGIETLHGLRAEAACSEGG